MDDPRAVVRKFILEECLPGESPDKLPDDIILREHGILDSLRLLQLVKLIEDTYGIQVEAHELVDANFGSVNNLVSFVTRSTKGAAAGKGK